MKLRALTLSSLQLEKVPGPVDMEENQNVTLPAYFIDCIWKASRGSSDQRVWMWAQSASTSTSIVPWPHATMLTFHHLHYDAKKISLKHNCTITSQSTNPFPNPHPSPPHPSMSNWTSNLSWCCLLVESRTSSTACSLFRSLSTAHICIDLQLFWSRRDGWQLYQEADPYWSERGAFTRPSFDGGRRSWLK